MSIYRFVVGAVLSIVVFVVFAGGTLWYQRWLRQHVADVESDIAAATPPGSTRTEVKRWLDSRHLRSAFLRADSRMDGMGYDNVATRAHLDYEQLSGCLRARIGRSISFRPAGIYIYFFFDKNDRLVKTSTEWIDDETGQKADQ